MSENESQTEDQDQERNESELDEVEKSSTAQRPAPTIFEWSVRLTSLAIILALTAYTIWQAVQPHEETRFELEAHRDEIRAEAGGWVVPIHITNRGTPALENLTIAVELTDPSGEVIEEETLTFPLIGEGEGKDAEVWFGTDPAGHSIDFNVGGYRLP